LTYESMARCEGKMTNGNSIINLGDFSKPATVLIKKISDALGGYFKPYQIKRVAKAEAEAEIIRAQTQIEVTDLQRRALGRFVVEEAKKQENIEKITEKAIPQIENNATPQNIEDDWVTNFFDKCRIISDKEMQSLWAKVLAGEANSPGKFSKRTVNFLSDLDKRDAELFSALCSFGWFIGPFTPLVFDVNASIYNDKGLNFNTLTHLDSIGLIQLNNLSGFNRRGLPKKLAVSYCGAPLNLTMEKEEGNQLPIGKVLLSKVGMELTSICQAPIVDEFVDYVKGKWSKYLKETENTEPQL
jgi:hypothetical protein